MRFTPARWSRPSGYYSYKGGVVKRRARPRIIAILVVAFIMGFAFLGPVFNPPISVAKASVIAAQPKLEQARPVTNPGLPIYSGSLKLQSLLNQWPQSHPDHQWSVVIRGLGNDTRHASVNGDVKFYSASLYKLLITYQLFRTYNLNNMDSIKISVDGMGQASLKSCVTLMIRNSDNSCGVAVGDLVGWQQATAAAKQMGLTQTNLNNASGPVTTANDVALFLQKMQAGQLFDQGTNAYLTGLMRQQIYRDGIPAGCGDCTVADKIGDLGFVRHDAGIVTYDGGQYVISILTDGASYQQIAQLAKQVQLVMENQ